MEYLSNYEYSNFSKVYLGENEPSEIVGKGYEKMNLMNGEKLKQKKV